MFPGRYFAARFYPPRYFGKAGQDPPVTTLFDGLTTSIRLTGVGH
jgi:hypothetical protein